jgi:hypothetical protein
VSAEMKKFLKHKLLLRKMKYLLTSMKNKRLLLMIYTENGTPDGGGKKNAI